MRVAALLLGTSGWRPVSFHGGQNGARRNDLGHLGRWSLPRWAFLGWYGASCLAWNWAVFELSMYRVIGRNGVELGMLLWPVAVVACALPVAWLWERRVEVRHLREVTELQRQRQEANLKLLVLQAQIEPHFLYNTLASLRALLREDVGQAESMVDALVSHLRAVLPAMRADSGISTLSDQLAICASYLELMASRMKGRLTYCLEVPGVLLHTPFPPLILLTLVENAIKHGIEPKAGAGCICIEAERIVHAAGCAIVVRVIDNGIGFSTGLGHGLGLRNVREQLALRYGEHAALSLSGPPEGGAVGCIQIPLDGIYIR
ncbi:MAG TPA: histidine kinase [Steroidobacteraceae bacterium]|jgi:LytS/YehU family sensor histidine kinase